MSGTLSSVESSASGGSLGRRRRKKIVVTDSIISMQVMDTFINKHGKKIRVVRIKKKKNRERKNNTGENI